MPTIIAKIDQIDKLIVDMEREDFQRHRIKKELIRRAFVAQPNANLADRLLTAWKIEKKYPTPIVHEIEWNAN
jgi:hypothetical protein